MMVLVSVHDESKRFQRPKNVQFVRDRLAQIGGVAARPFRLEPSASGALPHACRPVVGTQLTAGAEVEPSAVDLAPGAPRAAVPPLLPEVAVLPLHEDVKAVRAQRGHRGRDRQVVVLVLPRGPGVTRYAFDALSIEDEDLTGLPLLERKRHLLRIMPTIETRLLYLDHIERRGCDLFHVACERDLEGIVANWAHGTYGTDGRLTSWLKIKIPTTRRCAIGTSCLRIASGTRADRAR